MIYVFTLIVRPSPDNYIISRLLNSRLITDARLAAALTCRFTGSTARLLIRAAPRADPGRCSSTYSAYPVYPLFLVTNTCEELTPSADCERNEHSAAGRGYSRTRIR